MAISFFDNFLARFKTLTNMQFCCICCMKSAYVPIQNMYLKYEFIGKCSMAEKRGIK